MILFAFSNTINLQRREWPITRMLWERVSSFIEIIGNFKLIQTHFFKCMQVYADKISSFYNIANTFKYIIF